MVQPGEEREPLLSTCDEADSVSNGATKRSHSHVAKVKQCIAKNGILASAAMLVAISIVVFGAVVLTSKDDVLCATIPVGGLL